MATQTPYSKSSPQSRTEVFESNVPGIPGATRMFQWSDTLSGYRLPGWRRIIASGGDATTPLTATETTLTYHPATFSRILKRTADGALQTGQASGWASFTSGPPSGNPSTLDASKASRDASSKFYTRARQAQTQLYSGVVLGELRETLTMIRGRGRAMAEILESISTAIRRLKGTPRHKLKRIADLYLEMQFGWKPLASDIAGALTAYRDPRASIRRVSASASDESQTGYSRTSQGVTPLIWYNDLTTFSVVNVRIRGGVKVETSGHGRTLQAYGLLPSDFVVTAYELLPWSFLVDYFTDLGSVLAAISFPKAGLAYCSTSYHRELRSLGVTTGFTKPIPGFTEVSATFIPQVVEWRKKSISRVVGAPALPTPTVRLPKSLWQWANMLALAVSRRYSRLRI